MSLKELTDTYEKIIRERERFTPTAYEINELRDWFEDAVHNDPCTIFEELACEYNSSSDIRCITLITGICEYRRAYLEKLQTAESLH